ncbi:MAG: CoA pyrophosphatase [Gemmatimonadetes bacterium]|nr:CoA pyrophosphatase [Gemmatimonadota bacterium]MYI98947.1 CoA pyrophosphatase [Gemmatimonadota bacterium]
MTREQALVVKLRTRRGRLLDPAREALTASVALPLRMRGAGKGLELLYLLRARRGGDPWSGHISFPGGKIDASDASPRETAIRETREETRLDLTRAEYLCRLDDQATHLSKVHVAAFVYFIQRGTMLSLNHEIQRAYWVPLTDLMDENRYVTTVVSGDWGERVVPAINLLGAEGPVLWGLTYRFTAQVLDCIGHPLPGGSEVQLR